MSRAAAFAFITVASFSWAQDAGTPLAKTPELEPPPSAEMIRKVVDYLETGKDRGPALLDLVPCIKVDTTKGTPTSFQCIEPVTGQVKKGTTVFAWLQWYCPKDGKYDDVQIQFLHEGQVRQTIDLPVTGFGRIRGWRGANLSKIGKWTIKVSRGDKELAQAVVDVISN
jgi:hypothetical protein